MFRYDPEHEAGHPPRIGVVGIGGSGCRVVSQVHGLLWDALTIAINTDARSLNAAAAVTKIRLGAQQDADTGTDGDPDLGRLAAEHDIEMLRGLFSGMDIAILVTALGGGTGSGATPVVARTAAENGVLVMVLASMPFGFESARRREVAGHALDVLRERADILIRIDNDALIGTAGEVSAAQAFTHGIEALSEGVTALVRTLAAPSLLAVDVGDLKRVSRDTPGARIGFARASGPSRMVAAVDAISNTPLLDRGAALKEASFAVLCVAGSEDLTLAEVDGVVRGISQQLPRECDFVVGINIDSRWQDRLVLTVFVGARSRRVRPAPSQPQAGAGVVEAPRKRRRGKSKDLQEKLRFEESGKGRFKDVDATTMDGQDLDVPSFLRLKIEIEK